MTLCNDFVIKTYLNIIRNKEKEAPVFKIILFGVKNISNFNATSVPINACIHFISA